MKGYHVGIDVGSRSTKVVILSPQEEVSYRIADTRGGNQQEVVTCMINELLAELGIQSDELHWIVTTGYGRNALTLGQESLTEVTCHAIGALWFFPEARSVIDIGGQDSKVIKLDTKGRVTNFAMNDKCSAGTGRFLEVMASIIGVSLEEMGELALVAESEVQISSVCTVFAESEVISHLHSGTPRTAIIAGLCRSIANKIWGLAGPLQIEEPLVMTGGVAKNRGVVRMVEGRVKGKVLVPPEPQIVGALGAALVAQERCKIPGCKER